MAVVGIDMGNGTVSQVNIDGIENLSPEDQQSKVDEVKQAMLSGSSSPATSDTTPDDSLGGAFKAGVQAAAHGLGETAKLATNLPDWVPGRQTIADAGQSLENAAGTPASNVVNPVGSLVSDVKAGNWSGAGHEALRTAANFAPDVAGALASDVIPGGAYAYLGARNLGNTADARAANNNHATPTTGDILGAVPSTVAQAVVGKLGLGKVAADLPIAARIPAQIGLEGVAGAANDAAGQAGATAGTDNGLSIDPAEVGEAAVGGAAGRAASLMPELAKVGIAHAANEAQLATLDNPATPAEAQAFDTVKTMMDAAKAANPKLDDFAAANTVKAELKQKASDFINSAPLDTQTKRQLSTLLFDQALRHNNTITSGGDVPSLFDKLDTLKLRDGSQAPDEIVTPLKQLATTLNTISTQSFRNAAVGPFQRLGSAIGGVASIGGALASGNLAHAGMAAIASPFENKLGGIIGGAADRLLGTAQPSAVLQAAKARRFMAANGIAPAPNPLESMGAVNDALAAQKPTPQQPGDINFTASAPVPNPVADAQARAKAWQKVQGKPPAAPDMDAAWAQAESPQAQAAAQTQNFLSGMNLPGQTADPLKNTPTLAPATLPDASGDFDAQAEQFQKTDNARALQAAQQRVMLRNYLDDPDTLAQQKVDKTAQRHQVNLLAVGKTPDTVADGSTAGDAAFQQALNDANRTVNLASQANGLPPVDPFTGNRPDPVPVNEPVRPPQPPPQPPAQPQPPQPAPQPPPMAPQAAPAPPPQSDAPAELSAVGIAPEPPLTALASQQGHPWERYVSNGNPEVTRQHVRQAVALAHRANPEVAQAILASKGNVPASYLHPAQDVLQQAGFAVGRGAAAASGKRYSNPLAYKGAIEAYHGKVAGEVNRAVQAGNIPLANTLNEVSMTHGKDAETNRAAKAAIKAKHVAAHPEDADKFPDWLMNHGPKE